ncbi:class I SAM-dependent methyltransferase [Brachybacterium sacelli]|uniref:2-polyprenyl-3-methyl-5-hydroxy-6-metoxy-1, 4-benzoquinol methylase n=1 Tax=Brachybacterium sacelli TaxID=173364 RepID=A0ABS4WYN0_9MICO|nr:class I SAM-dependent methyltransferase [Brachybacterium sacelli]MBP2381310.1 2-polyprenyl-3-methyl-5-hydroxy-6-metoxy-1,4-benzoquinol methylase [Brachybacterium sacelli]
MILPPLGERDVRATERMDDPDCDRAMLERTYSQFRLVNSLVAGWRATYRERLRPHLHREGVTTLLDIGSGGGDLARALARWARRDGFDLRVTGIDPDERAHAWARHRPPVAGVQFRRADSSALVSAGERFDLVVSNHLLHHLAQDALQNLLADSCHLARATAVHSDIQRDRLGYALFSLGTRPVFRDSFIREDGLTSIRRSYTTGELRPLVPEGWAVTATARWRLLLTLEADRS